MRYTLCPMLNQKKIIVGVCGSIAAYKTASLVRLLIKAGAEVKVVMTPDAKAFITPLTLATLSKNPVNVDYFEADTGLWTNHVALGLWADLIIIAPATANTLAKLSNGICDNLLSAVYLSARCPVYLVPAMDLDMWKHPATQKNILSLQTNGNLLIPPTEGELASGLNGQGRMAEPEAIFEVLLAKLSKRKPLKTKRALVTAGPTFEPIDPVRFIGNHSSGKTGFAIAEELADLGASVTLISGPVNLQLQNNSIARIDVNTAAEMLAEVKKYFHESDIMVMSAAVADYTISDPAERKIKKSEKQFDLKLSKTVDILELLGQQKKAGQLLVGFALETDQEEENAMNKLRRKNLDFIVLNSLRDAGAGFKGNQNKITIIDKDFNKQVFDLKLKTDVAADICRKILELI